MFEDKFGCIIGAKHSIFHVVSLKFFGHGDTPTMGALVRNKFVALILDVIILFMFLNDKSALFKAQNVFILTTSSYNNYKSISFL